MSGWPGNGRQSECGMKFPLLPSVSAVAGKVDGMPVGLLGRKIGMTQVYGEDGVLVPVTVIEAGPCTVLQVRTLERDGYEAVQLGFADDRRERATRAARGHVASIGSKRQQKRNAAGVVVSERAECEPKKFIREFRTDGDSQPHGLSVGDELGLAVFQAGEGESPEYVSHIDVIGTSKGRGTAGVMKRHNFSGQRASHGVKRVHRHGGSIGMSADPARVLKGTRMAGRYGNARSTVRHLRLVQADVENNMLLVRGAVPGPNGGFLVLRHTNRH